ncbi:hypothetical protein ACFQY0_10280 [Haloferula chungangensis]|uniref:PA14 domain-containing protein n=1 Tax=Haloferula chungangensis TaxID=1048331 RepID=A0ABW2L8F7_9BACT
MADALPDFSGALHSLREDVEVSDLDVLESYAEALELEKEIAELYREVRSIELSQIQRQSLKRSLRQTLPPVSERWNPDRRILNARVKDGDRLAIYQEELQKLMQESDAIVSNAEELLHSLLPGLPDQTKEVQREAMRRVLHEMAEQGIGSEELEAPENAHEMATVLEKEAVRKLEESESSLKQALGELERAEELMGAGRVNAGGESNDIAGRLAEETLTNMTEHVVSAIEAISGEMENSLENVGKVREAMGRIDEALASAGDVNSELQARKADEPLLHTEEAVRALKTADRGMDAALHAAAGAARLRAEMRDGASSHQQRIAQQQVLQKLARAEAGTYLDLTRQMKGEDLELVPEPVPPEHQPPPIIGNFSGEAGRKLVKHGGISATWFHVNQWYILGPYDNRGRMNLQRVYPPESAIDLDAEYLGKNGARLTWTYDSFVEEMVAPSAGWGEYTIYYGFTELFFEEDADRWIAVGSDDRSDLWINDMPVWRSSNQLKRWSIDEGFRKVHFKKGRNKVVFRLENGWHNLGFSLLINAKPKY